MTATEHLCPACLIADVTSDTGAVAVDRPALPPPVGPRNRPDVSWSPSPDLATHSWEESR